MTHKNLFFRKYLKSIWLYKLFTLIELMVVVGIIIILISILMPALKTARGTVITISCANNLKQLGIATGAYCLDNNDYYPITGNDSCPNPKPSWSNLLYTGEYTGNGAIFDCPANKTITYAPSSTNLVRCYSINMYIASYPSSTPEMVFRQSKFGGDITSLSNLLLLCDGRQYLLSGVASHVGTVVSSTGKAINFTYRHNNLQLNMLFRDFHVDKKGRGVLYNNKETHCIPRDYEQEWWFY